MLGTVAWPFVRFLPRLEQRWEVARLVGKALCVLMRVRLRVVGEVPPPRTPVVIVANHRSFLDAAVLFLALPSPVVFVAGGDLARHRVFGPLLGSLGCVFVPSERRLSRASVHELTGRIAEPVRRGGALALFPEGGLVGEAGPRRFQLGAFLVAGDVGCPVVPVAIAGTAAMLAPGGRLPAPGSGSLEVRFLAPILPEGAGWEAARRLAGRARQAIAGSLGS